MEKEVRNFKKTGVVTLALISGIASAGTIGPICKTDSISMPCDSTDWQIGVKALYLQPFLGNVSGQRNFTVGDNSITAGEGTSWGFGFMIEGAYYFNTGNDVNLNWYHLNESATVLRTHSGSFLASDLGLSGTSGTVTLAELSLKTNPRWDAFNLEFGQRIEFGQYRHMRVHAGATFARIDSNTTVILNGANVSGGTSVSYHNLGLVSLTYNGFGPRVGADLAYAWNNGLGIYANGAGALLVGASKYSSFQDISGLAINGSNTVVVPELEAKLGATYSFIMARGTMSIDAGWMWENYIGSVSVANPSLIQGPTSSNFSVQGPFMGFKWLGNIG